MTRENRIEGASRWTRAESESSYDEAAWTATGFSPDARGVRWSAPADSS